MSLFCMCSNHKSGHWKIFVNFERSYLDSTCYEIPVMFSIRSKTNMWCADVFRLRLCELGSLSTTNVQQSLEHSKISTTYINSKQSHKHVSDQPNLPEGIIVSEIDVRNTDNLENLDKP